MTGGPDLTRALRDHKARAGTFLSQVAAALAGRGVVSQLSAEGGVPTLAVSDPNDDGPGTAMLVVDPDSWIECTWTPPPGTDVRSVASTIIAVLAATHSEW